MELFCLCVNRFFYSNPSGEIKTATNETTVDIQSEYRDVKLM